MSVSLQIVGVTSSICFYSDRSNRLGSHAEDCCLMPVGLVQVWCDHYTPVHQLPEPWMMKECEKAVISK